MMKDCWYMYLEGIRLNTFDQGMCGDKQCCQICYKFRIKNDEKFSGITFNSLVDVMSEPYLSNKLKIG